MMTRNLFLTALLMVSAALSAEELSVNTFRHVGPLPLQTPALLDSTNVDGQSFDESSLLQTPLRLSSVATLPPTSLVTLPKDPHGKPALHLAGFGLQNTCYTKARIEVRGLSHCLLYLDGILIHSGSEVELLPAAHEVVVKALTTATSEDSLLVSVTPSVEGSLVVNAEGKHFYTMAEVLHARRYVTASLSADGRWMIVGTSQVQPGGRGTTQTEVRELATGRCIERREDVRWMPRTNSYYYVRTKAGQRELVAVDPQTRSESVLASDIPEGYFQMTPTEDRLVYRLSDNGPEERPDVYEVVHPDDRQPGWRTRSHLAVYDLQTGLMQPLTFGHSSTYLADFSDDGHYALVMTSGSQLGKRPTEVSSLFRVNLQTMAVDTLVRQEGFISAACFSPDGRQLLLTGSPEAFGGVGRNVREGQTPSMIDGQLFLMDIASRKVLPLTRDFDPSVGSAEWSRSDGRIYFSAEDKDSVNLFSYDPQGKVFRQMALPEEVVGRFGLAASAPTMILYAQSASNSDRLYVLDLHKADSDKAKVRSSAARLLEDLSAETLRDVELGACEPYTYVNDKGESICCRYYLPPHFDSSRRYPMIVNYYGGCSPTSRNFESRYPQHAYAALGYVVLVVNPRGATGFGQQWSAQHVNTAGEGVAEDIIGAVRAFCKDHSWVNEQKIGCIGASYGGFMTQYLQTKTDLFAAAISHAGISDHTSYWGEGYWGYSYSEVSMANSYPWTRKDLFVDQSPLFNVEKIHTPLLFVHGDQDHNVPVGESIQMYTALKLLRRPTAMVLVKDQDHHITDYSKRLRWQQTIWAWFARWLQDDPTWWNSMYPEKDL